MTPAHSQTTLEKTPREEKERLQGHMDQDGVYRGFKLRNYYEWVSHSLPLSVSLCHSCYSDEGRMEGGVKDQIEQFNWQRDMKTQEFPKVMQPFLSEVKTFCEKTHNDVLFKVLRCEYMPHL